MADRYWVGGTDTWDATAGTKWAATSGGAGGESVPTGSDDVYFDANSGTGTITLSGNRSMRNLVCTGFTGTLYAPNTAGFNVNGPNITIPAGTTFTNEGYLTIYNAVTINAPKNLCDGPFASNDAVTLASDCSVGGSAFHYDNDFNLAGFYFEVYGSFFLQGTVAKSLTLNSGELAVWGTFSADTANTTVNAANGTLTFNVVDNNDVVTLNGGGHSYNDVSLFGWSGSQPTGCRLNITGSNTFGTLRTSLTGAKTFRFTAGTTQTITTFTPLGTPTLESSSSTNATLTKAGGGTVSISSATISDVNASPANTWIALSSTLTDSSGWVTGLPTVGAASISAVQKTTAEGSSSVTSAQGGDVLSRGFVYATSTQSAPGNVAPGSSPYGSNVSASGTFPTGAFSQTLTPLNGATTYYTRAFAQNAAGYTYSDEVNFTTRRYDGVIVDNAGLQAVTPTNRTTTPSAIINSTTNGANVTNL